LYERIPIRNPSEEEKSMRYVPTALTWAALLAFAAVHHPIAIAASLLALGAFGFTGQYRQAIVFGPMILLSASFENKGAAVLAFLLPRLLERPTFVGDTPYWRPGLLAVFVLLGLGALVGWLTRMQYRRIRASISTGCHLPSH
jgi:hypothetical protein